MHQNICESLTGYKNHEQKHNSFNNTGGLVHSRFVKSKFSRVLLRQLVKQSCPPIIIGRYLKLKFIICQSWFRVNVAVIYPQETSSPVRYTTQSMSLAFQKGHLASPPLLEKVGHRLYRIVIRRQFLLGLKCSNICTKPVVLYFIGK